MKERSDSEFIRVLKDLHEPLPTRGTKPEYMILENEASTYFQRELKAKNIDFQLSPLGMHCRNVSERTISTFKDHFITGLFSTNLDLPMKNWDRMVE